MVENTEQKLLNQMGVKRFPERGDNKTGAWKINTN